MATRELDFSLRAYKKNIWLFSTASDVDAVMIYHLIHQVIYPMPMVKAPSYLMIVALMATVTESEAEAEDEDEDVDEDEDEDGALIFDDSGIDGNCD